MRCLVLTRHAEQVGIWAVAGCSYTLVEGNWNVKQWANAEELVARTGSETLQHEACTDGFEGLRRASHAPCPHSGWHAMARL